MKRTAIAAIAVCASLLLAGCSANGQASDNAEAASTKPVASESEKPEPQDLELVESGYSVDSSGYVNYAVGVRNPNDAYEAQRYVVRVTGKDDAGSILFTDDQTMNFLLPKEEAWFACQAGNGSAPATVDFQLVAKDKNWIDNDHLAEPVYTIDQTNEVSGNYGMSSFTGSITALKEWKDVGSAWVSVIFRDEAGSIVGGDYTFVDVSEEGETAPFEISVYDTPDHASFEIAALPWF